MTDMAYGILCASSTQTPEVLRGQTGLGCLWSMPEVCPFHEEVVEGVKETARGIRGLQTS